jgi:hypothetical protein
MEIEEAKTLKLELEKRITILLKEYEEQTGCEIDGVYLQKVQHMDGQHGILQAQLTVEF